MKRNSYAVIIGYTTLRLAIGMSMLIHGATRLTKIPAFTDSLLKMFANAPLPRPAVVVFADITPFVELLIGILVFAGLGTRLGLTLGGLWMVILIFGSTLIEQYDIVAIQLLYSLIFFHLLKNLEYNALSLDHLIRRPDENI